MNHEALTFMNWVGLFLMIPAGIGLAWQIVTDISLNKKLTTDSIISILLFLTLLLGLAGLNMRSEGWLRWSMVIIQFVILILLFKMTWTPFARRLRELE